MQGMRYQPQGRARLARNALAAGLVFLTVDPLAPASISGHAQTQQGVGFIRSVIADGLATSAGSSQNTSGVVVLPGTVRDALVGKPITVAWVCDGLPYSSNTQSFYCHRNASTQAFLVGAASNNFQYSVSGFSDVFLSPAGMASATRFALTADGETVRAYANGNSAAAAATQLPGATAILPSILNRIGGARGVSANVAILAVWNRALSPEEVAQWQANPWQVIAADEEDEYVAAAQSGYALNVGAAALSLAGGQVGMRVSRRLQVAPASMLVAPSPVGMRASRRLPVAPVALALTGGVVAMSYTAKQDPNSYTLPVSAAAMTLTGGNVGMRVSRRLRVEPASLVLAGGAVRTLVGRRLMVSPAGLQLAGGQVTLRFSARGEPFDITKIHPSRLVIFEGSGSRITPFEGTGSRITPFEGSGSRITRFE